MNPLVKITVQPGALDITDLSFVCSYQVGLMYSFNIVSSLMSQMCQQPRHSYFAHALLLGHNNGFCCAACLTHAQPNQATVIQECVWSLTFAWNRAGFCQNAIMMDCQEHTIHVKLAEANGNPA